MDDTDGLKLTKEQETMLPQIAATTAMLPLLASLPGALFFADLTAHGGGEITYVPCIALFIIAAFEAAVVFYARHGAALKLPYAKA